MRVIVQRYLLLFIGLTLVGIGLAYCIDPDLLLARYDLRAEGASADSMYRGAYGGLFVALGMAISCGFLLTTFRQTATLLALLFMGGFALGRLASLLALGLPHPQIFSLLVFEVVTALACAWLLLTRPAAPG
ncbi:MAG: DUF4345 domain-containing protein [Pseudomonadota bacterium]